MMLPDTNIHMKYITKEAAIENVKKMFSNTSEDLISIQDVYKTWERDPEQEVRNKGWFSNKLINLKYHNLVKPVYVMRNHRHTLDKIRLTLEGKRALGKLEYDNDPHDPTSTIPNNNIDTITISDAMKIVATLRDKNPEYEITFDVKLKN